MMSGTTELAAQIHTIIDDLDRARADGTVYTYGNIQERLRNALHLASRKPEAAPSAEFPCAFQLEQCRCDLPRGHDGLHECRAHKFSDRALVEAAPSDADLEALQKKINAILSTAAKRLDEAGWSDAAESLLSIPALIVSLATRTSQPVQVEVTTAVECNNARFDLLRQLAAAQAVIAEALTEDEHLHPDRRDGGTLMYRILSQSPTDALQAVKAATFHEGTVALHQTVSEYMPGTRPPVNPYRAEGENRG